ncbi:hypothetical protein B296_00030938 [Ensete ventricosum]|uniref:Uncharacterized protein n=1 Tax=Ensete ventricosum TaxID=4639 RepID=A0A426XZT1_ENSVE|nr:hypothetical protein B296_00030938 [Ensete ventricosum]
MHLLRFPNSGIRAKVFVRKIGFKLHVMRRGSQPRPAPMQGRPPMARSTARGNRLRQRPHAMGRPTTAKAPCRGNRQHAWATTCKGDRSYRGSTRTWQHRPPTRCRLRAATLTAGQLPTRRHAMPPPAQGSDDDSDDAVKVREEG